MSTLCTMVCLILASQVTHNAKVAQTAYNFTGEGARQSCILDKHERYSHICTPLAANANGPGLGLDRAQFLISLPRALGWGTYFLIFVARRALGTPEPPGLM